MKYILFSYGTLLQILFKIRKRVSKYSKLGSKKKQNETKHIFSKISFLRCFL